MLQVNDAALLRAENARLREELAIKEEELIQLRQLLRPPSSWEPPIEIGLTVQEARVVASLYVGKGEIVSRDRIYHDLFHDSLDERQPKIVDVIVCKVRKKLSIYGINIVTYHSRGYSLDADSLTILNSWGIDSNEQPIESVEAA